ncbi:MAG: hypothetical protein ACOCRX_09905 [Candidatus Woesearchaeota archaeon]
MAHWIKLKNIKDDQKYNFLFEIKDFFTDKVSIVPNEFNKCYLKTICLRNGEDYLLGGHPINLVETGDLIKTDRGLFGKVFQNPINRILTVNGFLVEREEICEVWTLNAAFNKYTLQWVREE